MQNPVTLPIADCSLCPFRSKTLLMGRCMPGDTCVFIESGRQIDRFFRLNPNYDRPMTEKYISMLKAAGASTIFFNDTSSGAETWPEHNNHIHACFLKNPTVEKTCANFKPDLKICPELQ